MPGPIRALPAATAGGRGVCSVGGAGLPGPKGGSMVARQRITVPTSHVDRLLMAAWRALPLMPEDIRTQVASLLTRQAMLVIAGVAVVWAGSHFFGVGEAFDIVAGGLTWAFVGWDAIQGLKGYVKYYNRAIHASGIADIDQAAKYFAEATLSTISAIGWGRFAKWMGKGARGVGRAAGAAEAAEAQLARWRNFIEAIKFDVPRDQGMLWSSVGGARPAERLAKGKRLVTLEMALRKTGFQELMHNEFGTYANMSESTRELTNKIWKLVSLHYVRSLEGKVTAYVHGATHYGKIENAAKARIIGEPVSVSLHDVRKMVNPADPVIVSEVAEIKAMLLSNPKITSVELIDVRTGDLIGGSTPEIQAALQRLEQKSAGLPRPR